MTSDRLAKLTELWNVSMSADGCFPITDAEVGELCILQQAEIRRLQKENALLDRICEKHKELHHDHREEIRRLRNSLAAADPAVDALRSQLTYLAAEEREAREALSEVIDIIDNVLYDPACETINEFGDQIDWADLYRLDRPIQEQHLPTLREWFVRHS